MSAAPAIASEADGRASLADETDDLSCAVIDDTQAAAAAAAWTASNEGTCVVAAAMGNALAAAEALNALDVLRDAAMAAALKSNFDARDFCLAAACTSDCWNPPLELPVMPAVKGGEDDKVCVMGVGRSDNCAAAAAAKGVDASEALLKACSMSKAFDACSC